MKKKLATVWLGGCSGCHMSLLDMDERLLEVAKLAEIVKSPIVDGKEFPRVDLALVEGAVCGDEHAREIEHIRSQSKILVALGDCAVTGNVATLRNYVPVQAVLERSYVQAESNDSGTLPRDGALQNLNAQALPLHELVKVDYFIPGCPPKADAIFYVIDELLHDRVPCLSGDAVRMG